MNMRDILEKSLELCEKMSLEDLQKYPEAGHLIPLLRDALEQEEKCAHAFQNGLCVVCGFAQKL